MFVSIFFLIGGITLGALGCPAPRSPDGGQAFILDQGRVVEFACDPSFRLVGPQTVTCLDSGEWDQEFPVCAPVVSDEPQPVRRALFDWGQEEDNSTDKKGDEGQVLLTSQELQDEQRKRSGSPSVIYVRRPLRPQNDKGEDYLRRMYYHNNYYYHQRQHSYQQPPVSESQMAWIMSLHPELRDQYLRDMSVRLDYRPYDHYYYDRLYLRQPLTTRGEASLDYSCNRAGSPFVVAPRVSNARVLRYDRRQGSSRNHYLAAVYRCEPGFSLADSRYSELYCSGGRWVGPRPVCLPV